MSDNSRDDDSRSLYRRTVLGGVAGLGAYGLTAGLSGSVAASAPEGVTASGIDSFHPGHPRFVQVGEKLWNSAFVGPEMIGGRDNLAPRVPEASPNPEGYTAEDFTWSVAQRPEGSEVELTYQSSLDLDRPRYDEGRDNVAEFEADVPGTYVLELEAPDGTHELTIHAFPESEGEQAASPGSNSKDGTRTASTSSRRTRDSRRTVGRRGPTSRSPSSRTTATRSLPTRFRSTD
ncbi:hypothetical protein ACFQMM_05260 [Saliphagus sp. GCM10025308]